MSQQNKQLQNTSKLQHYFKVTTCGFRVSSLSPYHDNIYATLLPYEKGSLLSYISWFTQHANKHANLLKNIPKEQRIDYFRWKNISKTDADFCPLFAEGKKCHDMENLNCYLCACPNFRFDDSAKVLKSWCSIDSKEGATIEHNGVIHQDCSGCTVPHHESYVQKHLEGTWLDVMKKCHP